MNIANFESQVEEMNRLGPDGRAVNLDRVALTLKSLTAEEGITIGSGAGIVRTAVQRIVTGAAKVGGTAGWVVAAADNLPYTATLPASQTASTLVVPVVGLKVGDTITGFTVTAQIESAGGIATLDADLRAVTGVAAEPTDASIGAITQVSVTADTLVDAFKSGLSHAVNFNKTYYVLLTGTTAASTDIILLNVIVTVTEA